MLHNRIGFSLAALLAAVTPAQAAPTSDFEPDQVLMSYQVAMGAYQVSGVSTHLEWSVTAATDGSVHARMVVPVDSFESGHAEMDAQLRTLLGAGARIEIEGVVKPSLPPINFEGFVTLHGVTLPLSTSLLLTRIGARTAVRTAFKLDLDAFGVQRPAGLGRTVEVDFAARLRVHSRAVISGGVVRSASARF